MKNNAFKIILASLKDNLFLTILLFFILILTIVFSLLPPSILGNIINNISNGSGISITLILLYFLTLALDNISESFRDGLLVVVGQKVSHLLRSKLMNKYNHLNTNDLNDFPSGEIVSRFINDVDTIESLFTSGIIGMFTDIWKIVCIMVIIFINNKGLAILLLFLLPLIFIFTRYVQNNMLKAQLLYRKSVTRTNSFVPEVISNIRTIHNLNKQKYITDKYDGFILDSFKQIEKTNFYDAIYSPVILSINALIVAIVMFLSSFNNQTILSFFGMNAGMAVAIINYIAQIFNPIESLGMEIQTIQSALSSIKRINQFLSLPDFVREQLDIKDDTDYLKLNNVSFGYDKQLVIKDLNLSICKGEQVTLVGRTGAGKSTIFKLILGLYKPDNGKVILKGIDAFNINDKQRRKIYGYVSQSFNMVNGTIKQQISLFDNTISDQDIVKACSIVGLHDAIMYLENGYDTICDKNLFSQGQLQLLSIARAIVAQPELLLLDEITANLDSKTESMVLQALEKACKDRTVLSISHRNNAMINKVIQI